VKYVTDPRFGQTVCGVAGLVLGEQSSQPRSEPPVDNRITEMYSPVIGQSPIIDTLFLRLRKKLTAELRFQKELVKTKGALDMILSTAALSIS
jgi:U3 small nucleolar RNA-associated protein 15